MLLQVLKTMQNRVVFDGACDEMAAFVQGSAQAGGAENGEIVALRAAAGENHLARFAFENSGDAIARGVEGSAGLLADVMDARWIAVNAVQVRQHGGVHVPVERRGGVV